MFMQNNSQFIYSSPNGANTIMKNGPNQEIITTAEGVYMRNGSQTMFIPNHYPNNNSSYSNYNNNLSYSNYNNNSLYSNYNNNLSYSNYNNDNLSYMNYNNNINNNSYINSNELLSEDIRLKRLSYINNHSNNNSNNNNNDIRINDIDNNNSQRNVINNNNPPNNINQSHNDIQDNNDNNNEDEWGICPITGTYMEHPVITKYGHYYEKSAILNWLENHDTDPMTNQKLTKEMLFDDKDYENQIKEYKFIHNII